MVISYSSNTKLIHMVKHTHYKSIPKMFCSMMANPSILPGCLTPHILNQDLPNIPFNVMKTYESIFTKVEKTDRNLMLHT